MANEIKLLGPDTIDGSYGALMLFPIAAPEIDPRTGVNVIARPLPDAEPPAEPPSWYNRLSQPEIDAINDGTTIWAYVGFPPEFGATLAQIRARVDEKYLQIGSDLTARYIAVYKHDLFDYIDQDFDAPT